MIGKAVMEERIEGGARCDFGGALSAVEKSAVEIKDEEEWLWSWELLGGERSLIQVGQCRLWAYRLETNRLWIGSFDLRSRRSRLWTR